MSYFQLPTRTSSDPNSAADVNQLQANIDYIHALSAPTSKSADYTVLDDDGFGKFYVTTSTDKITLTLPTLADNIDRIIEIIKIDSGTGYVCVDGEGSEAILGTNTLNSAETAAGTSKYHIVSQYEGLRIQAIASGWVILDQINIKDIIGKPVEWPAAATPAGYIACDGSAISRTGKYARLFAVIGTIWGVGDGSTTFNVPDFRGATLRGVGTSTVFVDNSKTVTLGEVIDDQVQGHFHNVYTAGLSENAVIATRAGVGATANELAAGNSGTGTVDGLRIASMISNGANGTPRKGNETTGKARGVNFIIKI